MQKLPITIPIIFWCLLLSACGSTSPVSKNPKPDKDIQKLSQEYIKDAKPVDFTLTFTWFILEPFTPNNETTLSGWTLILKWKSQTWSFIQENSASIYKKWSDWYYDRSNILRSDTWNKEDLTSEKSEPIRLAFVPWFSKMRLLWKSYAFNESNLTKNGQIFDLEILMSKWVGYVVQFENTKEKATRQAAFITYDKKLADIKNKYSSDPRTMNSLIDELNQAYQLDATKF